MIHLVTGGSGSGKSEYAENWLTGINKKDGTYIYIATIKSPRLQLFASLRNCQNLSMIYCVLSFISCVMCFCQNYAVFFYNRTNWNFALVITFLCLF